MSNFLYLAVLVFIMLQLYVLLDIKKSNFKDGIADKITLLVMTVLVSPIGYFILSLNKKINLPSKDRKRLDTLKSLSYVFFILIYSTSIILTMFNPNKYGYFFMIISGFTLLGVIFFHVLYPTYWEDKETVIS